LHPTLCLFTDSLDPSGVGEHMLALAAELRTRFRVSVVFPPTDAGLDLLSRAAALGLDTFALEVRGERDATARFVDWLQERDVRIFHGHAGVGWEGHHAIRAARTAGVAAVLRTEHVANIIDDLGARADHARIVGMVDRLVCVSRGVADSFIEAGIPADKVRVVRNGIDLQTAPRDRADVRARLGLAPDARIVLTVARLASNKGHGDLAEAAAAIVARKPAAHLVWVGDGPLEPLLRAQVDRLGLASHVHLVGRRDDVPSLMAGSDVLVLPSLFEGLPLVVLEAMAAGLPVVATRVCGTDEAVVDGITGRLVEVGDVAGLADAVLTVLDRPDLAATWGAAGRMRAEREFSARRMAEETAAIYAEVLASSSPAKGPHRSSEDGIDVMRVPTTGMAAPEHPPVGGRMR
jgi:glycosyltransferase involved in cell wall biosynthesis